MSSWVRSAIVGSLVASAVLGAVPVADAAPGRRVVITVLHCDADGNDNQNPNGEFVVIKNTGTGAIGLTGWTVEDDGADHIFTFEEFTLRAGRTVRIRSGKGDDGRRTLYWKQGSAVWNNDTDVATLRRPNGRVVATLGCTDG